MSAANESSADVIERGGFPGRADTNRADRLTILAHLASACLTAAWPEPMTEDTPLSGDDFDRLRQLPAFRLPLTRAALACPALALSGLPADFFADVAESEQGEICIALLSASSDELARIARLCAAAVWHKEILRCAEKAERRRIQAALGSQAYILATQEAPMLYSRLSAGTSSVAFRRMIDDAEDDAALSGTFAQSGLRTLAEFVADTVPELAALFALKAKLRLQSAPAGARPPADHLTRFLCRRGPSWSTPSS